MAKQLNIFMENRPGRLASIAEVLYKNKINIITFTIQDRGDFGLVKMMVDKPKDAHLVLADKGYACALKEVLVVSIPDKPGNLFKLAKILLKYKVNISDAYGFVMAAEKQGICSLELALLDKKKIKSILIKEGFSILEEEGIYELV